MRYQAKKQFKEPPKHIRCMIEIGNFEDSLLCEVSDKSLRFGWVFMFFDFIWINVYAVYFFIVIISKLPLFLMLVQPKILFWMQNVSEQFCYAILCNKIIKIILQLLRNHHQFIISLQQNSKQSWNLIETLCFSFLSCFIPIWQIL